MKTKTKASWLRSEIEKLEGMKEECEECENREKHETPHNNLLDTIITRYKEELLELEKGDN